MVESQIRTPFKHCPPPPPMIFGQVDRSLSADAASLLVKDTTYSLSHKTYLLAWVTIILMCLFYCFSPASLAVPIFGWGTIILACLLMFTSPFKALLLTTAITHLGPIVRSEISGIGIITIGDIFLLLILLTRIPSWLMNTPKLGWLTPIMLTFIPLTILTIISMTDLHSGLSGLLNFAQFFIVFLLAISLIKTEKNVLELLDAIGMAILLSACVHLFWYTRGVSLLLSLSQTASHLPSIELGLGDIIRTEVAVFQKNAFFYGSFIASCSAGIMLSFCNLLNYRQLSYRRSIFWMLVGITSIGSTLVAGTRTSIVAGIIASGFVLALQLAPQKVKDIKLGRIIMVAIAVTVLVVAGILLFSLITPDLQREVFSSMFLSDASKSFSERLEMWWHATTLLFTHPLQSIIGIGPDLAMKAPQAAIVRDMYYVPELNFQVPSFHNFYIDLVFQHGIIFASLFFYWLIRSTWSLIKDYLDLRSAINLTLVGAILSWLLTWNSHATGWSKPVLIFAQLLALALFTCEQVRKHKNNGRKRL